MLCLVTATVLLSYGEVAEWLNATHSKCVMVQAIVGSNPTLSVEKYSRQGFEYFCV